MPIRRCAPGLLLATVMMLGACAGTASPPQCREGERRCDPTATMEISCVRDANGQLRFGQPVPCASGGRCENGRCTDTCGTCDNPPGPCYRSPGSCYNGQCRYDALENGQTCDDGDACTTGDTCVDGQCKGKSTSCTKPPANVCKDASTLTVYTSPGNCSEGSCVYPSADLPCSSGCVNAVCSGDPCVNIKCETPPNKQCYDVPGICSSGKCTYIVKTTQACNDGNPCTKQDKCDIKGTCVGTPYVCNDYKTCTVDTCDGSGGCIYTSAAGNCLIGSVCYAQGTFKTGDACEYCDSKSPTSWSAATGTAIQTWNFDDGTLQGFTVAATTSPVKWQVDGKRYDSPSKSLYFGNPATYTFNDPDKAVSGQATSPTVTMPVGAGKLCLAFRMFKNTEPGSFYDKLTVTLLPAGQDIFQSSTEPENAITKDPTQPTNFIFRSFAAEIPASAAGTAVQFRFGFASGDAAVNTGEGVYVDTIQVLKGCTP